jgi:hypothetical protein
MLRIVDLYIGPKAPIGQEKRVLADIDADHGDRWVEFLGHGVLRVLGAPCQLLVLAGPEHGRTIPLSDVQGSP